MNGRYLWTRLLRRVSTLFCFTFVQITSQKYYCYLVNTSVQVEVGFLDSTL